MAGLSIDNTRRLGPIELTDEEHELLQKVEVLMETDWLAPRPPFEERLAYLEAAHDLTASILHRGAIPQARLDYFTDPQHSIGTKLSRMQVFERNGTVGDDILRHPHFLKYLHYFMFGPDLPEPVIEGFCDLVGDYWHDASDLRRYARTQVRKYGLDKHRAAEEFNKLAIECGVSFPRRVRDAVMRLRY